MKCVTRTIEETKVRFKIYSNDGKETEREYTSFSNDVLNELKKQYPNSGIVITEMFSEQNKYRMSYEDFIKYGELVK